jgi:uncharacterized protein YbjT (DUF2867 family)
MSTILVTGATGTLGRAVVRALVERRHRVRAYTHGAPSALPPGVEAAQGDLRAGTGLAEATRGVDAIVHTATFFEEGYATDLEGTRHLLAAASGNGSPHVVYISIVGIERSAFSYFRAKHEVERMIEASGLPWSILRATQFHDFVRKLITSAEDAGTATMTLASGVRFQSIDKSEVAASLATLAESPAAGRVADMGGPEVLTLEDMARSYLRATGKQSAIRTEPLEGELYDAFRTDHHLAPGRAVGRVTWEEFLGRGE